MEPNLDSRRAYSLGYQDAEIGKTEGCNPFVYVGGTKGASLAAWWSTGFTEQQSGKPSRWPASKPKAP